MSMFRLIKALFVITLVLILQLELFSNIRFFGVMPELMLGLAIASGWHGGPSNGALTGFVCGFAVDLYLATPLGLSALSYALIGYLLGVLAEIVAEDVERIVRLIISIAAIALGLTLFVFFGELIAEPNLYNKNFGKILVVGALYTGLFIPVLHYLMSWVFHGNTYQGSQRPINSSQLT